MKTTGFGRDGVFKEHRLWKFRQCGALAPQCQTNTLSFIGALLRSVTARARC
jgi:hypothetical protein